MNIRRAVLASLTVGLGVMALGALSASVGACSVSSSNCGDGGTCVTVKTQPETDGPQQTKTSQNAWVAGDVIEIANANGSVIVHGAPNATTISATMTPFARSDSAGDADANATIQDVIASFAIDYVPLTDGSGFHRLYVHCDHGKSHGTSNNANAGCKNLTVTIPASGLKLKAATHAGDVTAPDALTAADGQQLIFTTGAGSVSVANVTGGVMAHSDVGDASASVTPAVGSVIEVSSGNGNVAVTLPNNFAADHITLKGDPINVTGFGTDFTKSSTSRGTAGMGAASITVTTDLGQCDVKSK